MAWHIRSALGAARLHWGAADTVMCTGTVDIGQLVALCQEQSRRRRRDAPPGSPVNRLRAALDLLETLLERRRHHRQRSGVAVGKVQDKRVDHQTCYFSGDADRENTK